MTIDEDLKSLQEEFEIYKQHYEENTQNLNQFFLVIMGAIVMFMQAGFAFLEAGSVRSKNVVNILLKNALDCFCGAVIYWMVGFAFAYGDVSPDNPHANANKFIGFKYFFSIYQEDYDHYFANWFFQFVFAATASTIVSGAVAERTQFGAYMIYSSFITGFVYPVVTHWGWSGTGWLAGNHGIESMARHSYAPDGSLVYNSKEAVSYVDFAGSGLVHCTGGICALMGAIIIGPRIGRFSTDDEGKQFIIPGHSVPIAALGAFILFLGFLAFNGGSELQIVGGGQHGLAVALSFMNTIIGGAAGSVAAILVKYLAAIVKGEPRYWSLLTCINGGLCGMVAMCAGCNNFHQGAAFGIGAIAGITMWWVSLLLQRLSIDDPLDAFAVHYGGGVVGVLLTPIFMTDGIIAFKSCKDQESEIIAELAPITPEFKCDHFEFKVWAWNLCGLICITLWAGLLSLGLFLLLSYLKILRVDRDIELKGLDIKKHGEPAYPTRAYGHGWEKEGDFDLVKQRWTLTKSERDEGKLEETNSEKDEN